MVDTVCLQLEKSMDSPENMIEKQETASNNSYNEYPDDFE
jgi:hypothetical protein